MDGERSRSDAGNKVGVYAWRRKGEHYDRKEKTEKNNGWNPCGCDRGGKCGNPLSNALSGVGNLAAEGDGAVLLH